MFENLQNSFNGMFGKIEPGLCRLTMNGNIAVKCRNGFKSYNVKKGTLTNVTNFCFNIGDEMFFVIPTNRVEVGDATLDTITSVTGQLFDFVDFEQDFKNGDCLPIGGLCGNKKLHINEFKPYLRPMSSMTDEEADYLQSIHDIISNENHGDGFSPSAWNAITEWEDYCNARYLDYRWLIEKGLALEAPEGMYKTESHDI